MSVPTGSKSVKASHAGGFDTNSRVFKGLGSQDQTKLVKWLESLGREFTPAPRETKNPGKGAEKPVLVTSLLHVYHELNIKAGGAHQTEPKYYTLPLSFRQSLLKAISHTISGEQHWEHYLTYWKLGFWLYHSDHGKRPPFEVPGITDEVTEKHNWDKMLGRIKTDPVIKGCPHKARKWLTDEHPYSDPPKRPRIEGLLALGEAEALEVPLKVITYYNHHHDDHHHEKKTGWDCILEHKLSLDDCIQIVRYEASVLTDHREQHPQHNLPQHDVPSHEHRESKGLRALPDLVKQWTLFRVAIRYILNNPEWEGSKHAAIHEAFLRRDDDKRCSLVSPKFKPNWLNLCAYLNLLDNFPRELILDVDQYQETRKQHQETQKDNATTCESSFNTMVQGTTTHEQIRLTTFYSHAAYHLLHAMVKVREHEAHGDHDVKLATAADRLETCRDFGSLGLAEGRDLAHHRFFESKSHRILRHKNWADPKRFQLLIDNIYDAKVKDGAVEAIGLRDLEIRKNGFDLYWLVLYAKYANSSDKVAKVVKEKHAINFGTSDGSVTAVSNGIQQTKADDWEKGLWAHMKPDLFKTHSSQASERPRRTFASYMSDYETLYSLLHDRELFFWTFSRKMTIGGGGVGGSESTTKKKKKKKEVSN